jgi:light-regulated signal transduction histidine kinase (bacteriophytochrome)
MLNPSPIIEVDLAGGIHFCNPSAERLFPDLRQRELEHPLLTDWEAVVRAFCDGGLKESTRELKIQGRWYQETIHFMEETRHIHIYGRDITARKKAEEELIERTDQLEAANKELESFSYSVSHDLKAPLRAIEGYSRMLLKKDADKLNEDTIRKLDAIRSNAEKMNVLIDDLLSFSRVLKSSIAISEINMDKLVKEAWAEIQAANTERKLDLRVTSMLPGKGDPALIRQVLVNLLSNAVKFTKNRTPGIIEVSCYTEPGQVVYSVKDNGVGFNMAYYDKLFAVFQRLHGPDEYEGTGVGLAIAQRIILRHGGRVWTEGEVRKGATFYFTLPVTPEIKMSC